jgi:Ser/Thr protein kinase RdoA (MazF antagonist)
MHRLARAALDLYYGLGTSRVKLVALTGNALYRVYAQASERSLPPSDLFEEGQLLLRLHWPGYRAADEIETELLWLAAMRREKELPVPEPLPTPGGELLATVSAPGVPEARQCSLLRWVKGRRVGDRAGPHHCGAQGHLMAELHDSAATWPPVRHFTPPTAR